LVSGHMPGALNLPFDQPVDNGMMKSAADIRAAFAAAGADLSRPVITSCGSGVTAAVLLLAPHHLGHPDVALYGGGWAGWGSADDAAVETSACADQGPPRATKGRTEEWREVPAGGRPSETHRPVVGPAPSPLPAVIPATVRG